MLTLISSGGWPGGFFQQRPLDLLAIVLVVESPKLHLVPLFGVAEQGPVVEAEHLVADLADDFVHDGARVAVSLLVRGNVEIMVVLGVSPEVHRSIGTEVAHLASKLARAPRPLLELAVIVADASTHLGAVDRRCRR